MEFLNMLVAVWVHLVTSLVIFAHVLVGGFAPKLSYSPTPLPAQIQVTTVVATSTPSTKTATSTAKTATSTPKIAKKVTPPAATTTSPLPSPVVTPLAPTISSEDINTQVRQSLVNILCTPKYGGPFATISGSGIIIDSRGVVLTNAHVAQYFLLRDYLTPDNIVCVIRTGSPATAQYTAKLLYLPPAWVSANASQIKSQHALGTGENDYAFLLITGPVSYSVNVPPTFPAVGMALQEPSTNDGVLLAAYPAGFFGGEEIQKNLYASSALSTVSALYTFTSDTHIDLVAVSGTIVSQSGSSGGAVARLSDGKLVGLIATATTATNTADRGLFAITLAHIHRSLTAAGQGGIPTLLSGDINQKSADFNANAALTEAGQIESYLSQQ